MPINPLKESTLQPLAAFSLSMSFCSKDGAPPTKRSKAHPFAHHHNCELTADRTACASALEPPSAARTWATSDRETGVGHVFWTKRPRPWHFGPIEDLREQGVPPGLGVSSHRVEETSIDLVGPQPKVCAATDHRADPRPGEAGLRAGFGLRSIDGRLI